MLASRSRRKAAISALSPLHAWWSGLEELCFIVGLMAAPAEMRRRAAASCPFAQAPASAERFPGLAGVKASNRLFTVAALLAGAPKESSNRQCWISPAHAAAYKFLLRAC